jgi:predicted DCC family thiol-disulfide oxidoreductase YuxK
VPRPLRDLVYDFIARRRLRWFGTRASCMVPTKELRARFLDAGEAPAAGHQ